MIMNWNELKKFVNSREGQAVISFIIGKNSTEIGKWIQTFGKIISKEGAISKAAISMGGKAALKVAGLCAAVYIAYEDARKSFTKVGKAWSRDDLSVIEKVGKNIY